ncbi:FMN-dependent NADH-azoreductase [Asaia lannensis]|uniref:FMN dependent NADH:quinone oxidoreductase n=1 Tax=Asaia lannensis NBRC 102526 TaxID=1307926 RepID=A0ABT1CG57_9PROT|nr:FMN-dependent NADH-azoreductase [Asaia lannensis]MCO6159837.1 FMN-dependent NADH-azoreductase [Asaia lannensis NBRC 102526]GBQ96063.1 ACP phosphodiesterase [Asaia lannensis NBRC 102526]
MKILHIDSSILGDNSASRALSAETIAHLRKAHPQAEVTYHDLAANPIPLLSADHVAARFGGEVTDETIQADLARGNAHVDELFAADVIVIGVPMYNFTIPAQLKDWIDRIVVAGKTFSYGEHGPVGLIPAGKKLVLISTRGGNYTPGNPAAVMDHQEPYMSAVLGFLGLRDLTWVRAEGLSRGPEAREAAMKAARAEIAALSI